MTKSLLIVGQGRAAVVFYKIFLIKLDILKMNDHRIDLAVFPCEKIYSLLSCQSSKK